MQKRISKIQKQIRKDSQQRNKTLGQLEKIDNDIADKRKAINSIASDINKTETEIKNLEAHKQEALNSLSIEEKQLVALIQVAHRQQDATTLKWLLEAENPADLARTMTYYKYLMQSQRSQLQGASAEVKDFVELLDEAQVAKDKLLSLKTENENSITTLQSSRDERTTIAKKLNESIQGKQGEVKALSAQEASLLKVIGELEKALADFPDTREKEFKSMRGKLAWPLKGKLKNSFGRTRISGQGLKWKGVIINAERNTEVRAIAYGRVVYADWLPGLGLITIIDHGSNYMSLYGNAEMLFKDVGAWVNAGDVVALVGDSGGTNGVGLYFEIRKGKQALNPTRWFKTRRP